jgi:hypothetical protein
VGVFNATPGGDMLSRSKLTTAKPLESTDTWNLTYNLVLARA